jgi:hypothetical protein
MGAPGKAMVNDENNEPAKILPFRNKGGRLAGSERAAVADGLELFRSFARIVSAADRRKVIAFAKALEP